MQVVNSIKTEVKTTIQGIDVVISTEYVNVPSIYVCNVSQQLPSQEGDTGKWINVNYTLNVDTRSVQVGTNENIPVGFLAALELAILEAADLVMSGINSKTKV